MRRLGSLPVLSALPLLLVACAPRRAPTPPVAGAPVSCRPDRLNDEATAQGKSRVCVIDVGSRNVKLVVATVEEGDPRSLTEERVCRARLQLGEKTFDQTTRTARPLGDGDRESLVRLLADYLSRCQADGGRMLGAVATEWARRATNPDDIRRAVEARTGIALEILSREREGRYGYLAATRGAPGKIVLDFGSRSLQVSYWPRGAAAPVSASLPLGIDEAGDRFFGRAEFQAYGPAREAFVAAVRDGLGATLAQAREAIAAGKLSPELYSLAENGDVALALDGKLWDAGRHETVDERSYVSLITARLPSSDPDRGRVTAVLPVDRVLALGRAVDADAALFEELRGERIKRIYGYKMLAYPAIVAYLTEALGSKDVVLVPQEMPAGMIVEKLK
jgi:hypothetical protein